MRLVAFTLSSRADVSDFLSASSPCCEILIPQCRHTVYLEPLSSPRFSCPSGLVFSPVGVLLPVKSCTAAVFIMWHDITVPWAHTSRGWGWRAGGSRPRPEQGDRHSAADLEGPPSSKPARPSCWPSTRGGGAWGCGRVKRCLAGGDQLWVRLAVPLCGREGNLRRMEKAPSWATSPQMLRSVGADFCPEQRRLCRRAGLCLTRSA